MAYPRQRRFVISITMSASGSLRYTINSISKLGCSIVGFWLYSKVLRRLELVYSLPRVYYEYEALYYLLYIQGCATKEIFNDDF